MQMVGALNVSPHVVAPPILDCASHLYGSHDSRRLRGGQKCGAFCDDHHDGDRCDHAFPAAEFGASDSGSAKPDLGARAANRQVQHDPGSARQRCARGVCDA